SLFFALEPIGMRLFGHIDRPFQAVQGGQVTSGLYQAVTARLPNAINSSYTLPVDSAKPADKNLTQVVATQHSRQDIQTDTMDNSYSHHELQSTPEPVKADTVLAKANLSTASLESL